jgi:hypothetical protein
MNIEDELEDKSIERDTNIIELEPEPEPVVEPVKKTKKARSPAQIAAFERARLARLEKVKIKKEKEKETIKEKTPTLTEALKEVKPIEEKKLVKSDSIRIEPKQNNREQVIQNHYYYYGVPPPTENLIKSKKKKKIKKPVIPVSSSSEEESESSEEEEEEQTPLSPVQKPAIYKELQNYEIKPKRPPQQKQFKFAYSS